MSKILIFAGTTEGRRLAEILSGACVSCTVCVATEYGETVMGQLKYVTVRQGRMNGSEMQDFMMQEEFEMVVDATHPYATLASVNIRMASEQCKIPYLRLRREAGNMNPAEETGLAKIHWFSDNEACAEALAETRGNILLTTGSKELSVYCRNAELRERLYVRVLPGTESIGICEQNGIPGSRIIAMQGPFSEELNRVLLRQYQIQYLVTKESGRTGGFFEKLSACNKEQTEVWVIGNPEQEKGLSFRQVVTELAAFTGIKQLLEAGLKEKASGSKRCQISLAGIGMGNPMTLTKEVEHAVLNADYIFGAKRLLQTFPMKQRTYPYYLAKDILPELDRILEEGDFGEELRIAVLFSGDTGFYSGCGRLYQELSEWGNKKEEAVTLRVLPGISSVSGLAAACGTSWQDGVILSVHGRTFDRWQHEVTETVRQNPKTFLLVSGAADIRALGTALRRAGLQNCAVTVGYRLSYPDQKLRRLTTEACISLTEEGLYTCLIENEKPEEKSVTHGYPDHCFIRDNTEGKCVPMTKEEVREIAICKLHLTENSVVYDIGSGSGSVAVEIAKRSGKIRVFAVECKENAASLTQNNCEKFHTGNVSVVSGMAPEALTELPLPTHAFIGGSSGNLKEILNTLYRKNNSMRIVITAVTLETKGEITDILADLPVQDEEIIEVQVARAKKAGRYHLMQAENPILICSFFFAPQKERQD